MKKYFIAIIILILATSLSAQKESDNLVVPIEFITNCGDLIGDSLVTIISEKIDRHENLKLANGEEIRIILQLTSMDRLPERPNLSCIYSSTWLLKTPEYIFDTYLTSELGITSKSIVEKSAEGIVNKTYQFVLDMKAMLK